jgi:hypothetical protein
MTTAAGERRLASPVRLTLSSRLGHDIDGAWWLRTGRIAQELPELVAVLGRRLGEIVDIKVNWSSLESPPNLNLPSWLGKRQHVITISGRNACANLLIVPDRTGTPLALMVLRQAAGLPIESAHRDTQAFRTADCVVRAARTQHEQIPPRPMRARRATSQSADIATTQMPSPPRERQSRQIARSGSKRLLGKPVVYGSRI